MSTALRSTLAVMLTILALSGASTHAADIVWTNPGGGNWNVGANWTPNQVPGAADNALITNVGTYTVTVPAGTTVTAGTVTVGGTSGTQTLAIDRATLTLNGASAVNANGHLDFLVSQSVLTGAGNLTVNGTLNWANGTMSGTGATTIGSGGVLAIGSGGVTLARTLNHGGTGTWGGGNFTLSAGAAFNNLVGGTFDITADGRLSGSGTTPITNSGLLRQTAGTASTIVTAPLNNAGTLEVLAATLSLNLGGTHSGTISNALGATLNLGGGSHVLAASSLVTGAGVVSVSGSATLTADGTFDVTGSILSVTAGTATLAAGCNVTGATLNIGNGILNFDSTRSVAVLNLTGGTLGGAAPVTVTGPLTLGGGTITNALVTAEGGLTIDGNVTLNGGTLVNPTNALWSAGNFNQSNGAVFSNLLGATFTTTFDGNDNVSGATPLFVNAGTFRKTGGTLNTSIDAHFINTGTVEVPTGTLRYGPNQQTAGLTLLDGGGLDAQAQPIQFLGGSLMGTGLVTVANTQTVLNSAAVDPGLPLGQLDIAGNYSQAGSGVLNIELGGSSPGTDFDLVTVSRTATLGGTLNVTTTNGFSPAFGETFTFLTALSRVGTFATFNYPSNEVGLQVNYDAISATLKVTNLKPVITPIADQAVDELATLSFAATATDPDLPAQTLTWSLVSGPAGLVITSGGLISWTPTEAEGPSTNAVTVRVTDNGTPPVGATASFQVVVHEINVAPTLILPSSQALDELAPFTAAATALDPDLPTNSVTFELLAGPPGLTVSTNGEIAWTPVEAQGPGVYPVTVRVTDSNPDAVNAQHLSDTNTFTLTVNEVNQAPVLNVPGDQTVNELTLLSVQASATDPDVPANPLTFALVSPPSGMIIDPVTGQITWTPSQAQSPGTNVILVSVTDTNPAAVNARSLSVTNSFTVVVREVNVAPVLPAVALQAVDELTLLAVTNAAIESNLHATVGYALLNPPFGASIDPNGVITWTPTEAQGPGTNTITTVATSTNLLDLVNPQLRSTNAFIVVVNEVNVAPVLTVPGDQTVNELTLLSVQASATDPDVPANPLTFGLVSPPTGMIIDPATGQITWTPSQAQSPGTNIILVSVTDTNTAAVNARSLSVTNSFTVIVHATVASQPLLSLSSMTSSNVTLSWTSTPGRVYRVQRIADVGGTTWTDLVGDITATGNTSSKSDERTSTNQFYRVRVLP